MANGCNFASTKWLRLREHLKISCMSVPVGRAARKASAVHLRLLSHLSQTTSLTPTTVSVEGAQDRAVRDRWASRLSILPGSALPCPVFRHDQAVAMLFPLSPEAHVGPAVGPLEGAKALLRVQHVLASIFLPAFP